MAYYIYPGKDGKYYWRLIANNNRTIADSGEGYNTKEACLHGIALVKSSSAAPVYESK